MSRRSRNGHSSPIPPVRVLSPRPPRRFLSAGRLCWVGALLVAGLSGCKGWRVEHAAPAELIEKERPELVRLTRASDSAKAAHVEMYYPIVKGDSLRGMPTEAAIRPFSVPMSQITEIATRHFSLGKTVLLVFAIGAGALAYDLLMSLNQTSF